MLFAEKIIQNRDAFLSRVQDIASTLGFPADWLMLVMGFETGFTFDPAKKNPYSTATGLIQFMEATAKDLGTTTAALAKMSNVEQLEYVYKYLARVHKQYGPFTHPVDLYLAVFYPASIPQDFEFIYPNSVYAVNKGFDIDKDGRISKKEIQDKILSYLPASYQAAETFKKKNPMKFDRTILMVSGALLIGLGVYLLTSRLSA